ncbi:MAG: caspase domain-containing protein [Crocosphaera sp.]
MKHRTFKKIKSLTLLLITVILFSFGIASAQRNSFTVTDRNGKDIIVYQESHALIIWAGNYEHWSKLNNVESEAKNIKKTLERQGFEVTVVENPNGNELRNKIQEFINDYGYIHNNRLVIFFAGHGHTRKKTRGYLVPVDAPDPTIDERGFLRAALPMRQIMTWAQVMEAKHALFVFDSCFSGTIFKQRSEFNARDRYVQDVMNKPVRQFLTAGDANQTVPGKSLFTPLFIRALEGEADLYKDGYVTGTELGIFMRQNLSVYTKQQTPQFGTIRDPLLDQGDIVFQTLNPQSRQLIAQNLPRKALVIGNAAYRKGGLNNPVNDANAVAKALRDLGFDVTPRTNLNLRSMHEEIEQFSQELTEGGVGLFYYAGHGVQVQGENYLIPLEAQLKREKDVKYDAYPLGKVMNTMEVAKTRINILIIDACRDNPFYRSWRSQNRLITRVKGLEELEANQGWFIAFATAPGMVAEDGKEFSNSPFTYHLLRHLKTPGEDIDLMFRRVKKDVLKATNNEQRPWVRNGLLDPFHLNPSTATTDSVGRQKLNIEYNN